MTNGFRYHRVEPGAREDVAEELEAAWIDCLHHQLGWGLEEATARAHEEQLRTRAGRLLRVLDSKRGWQFSEARVLDVGAGAGALVLELLARGADAWGIEPGPDYAELARQRLRLDGYDRQRILEAPGEAVPFGGAAFDYVISLQVLEHVRDPEPVIREIFRVLKPGGRCYLSCENYLAFREQEYRVPWLPLLPKSVAVPYLRLLGRDPTFLIDHVHYTTYPQIWRMCSRVGFVNETYQPYLDLIEAPKKADRAHKRLGAQLLSLLPVRLRPQVVHGLAHAARTFRVGVHLHLRKPV